MQVELKFFFESKEEAAREVPTLLGYSTAFAPCPPPSVAEAAVIAKPDAPAQTAKIEPRKLDEPAGEVIRRSEEKQTGAPATERVPVFTATGEKWSTFGTPANAMKKLVELIGEAQTSDTVAKLLANNPTLAHYGAVKEAAANVKPKAAETAPAPAEPAGEEIPYAKLQAAVLKVAAKDRQKALDVAAEFGAATFKDLDPAHRGAAIARLGEVLAELEG